MSIERRDLFESAKGTADARSSNAGTQLGRSEYVNILRPAAVRLGRNVIQRASDELSNDSTSYHFDTERSCISVSCFRHHGCEVVGTRWESSQLKPAITFGGFSPIWMGCLSPMPVPPQSVESSLRSPERVPEKMVL